MNIKVGIAGRGTEREKLEKKIIELSLQDNVDLLGYVKNSTDFYNSGRVFVLTSSTEGLPRTVVESMACGVPCVVSKVGDIEDLVKNNGNGFVIDDYTDLNGFAKKIALLLSNSDKYNHFSNESIIHVNKNYSQHAATAVWKQILSKINFLIIIHTIISYSLTLFKISY